MKKVILIIIGLIILGACVNMCTSETTEVTNVTEDDKQWADSLSKAQGNVKTEMPAWIYRNEFDKMDDDTTFYAIATSENEVSLSSALNELQPLYMTVRKSKKLTDVALRIGVGQFYTEYGNSKVVRVKFDNDKASNWTYLEANDASSDVIFIKNSSAFIQKLKSSKEVLIETPFFQDGSFTFEFKTNGLKI